MKTGLIIAILIFTLIDAAVFLFCAVLMMRFICMYTQDDFKRSRPLFVRFLGWAGYILLAVLLPNLFWNDAVTVSVLLCYYLLFGWMVYHKSPVGLLYQVVYILVMYASQAIAIMLANMLYLELHIQRTTCSYLLVVFKAFFHICILFVLWKIMQKRYAKDQKNLKTGRMALIPFLSLGLILLYIVSGDAFFARHSFGYGWVIVFCLIILVINGYCLYFWYDLSTNQELRNRLELIQKQNNLTYQYYEEMEENYNQSRKIIHDIRNHMHMLEQSCRMDEAESYFTDVHEMLNALGLKFYCENRMLNIVLND